MLIGDLVTSEKRLETFSNPSRPGEGHFCLLDREFIRPSLLGPWESFEEFKSGFQPVAGRGLLRQVGKGDGPVEFDDGLTLLDRLALLDQEFVNVPFDCGSQGREFIGDRFQASETFDGVRNRAPRLAARSAPDKRVLIAGRWLALSLRCVTTPVTSYEPKGEQSCKHPASCGHNKIPRLLICQRGANLSEYCSV